MCFAISSLAYSHAMSQRSTRRWWSLASDTPITMPSRNLCSDKGNVTSNRERELPSIPNNKPYKMAWKHMSVMSSVAVEKDGSAIWCLYSYCGLTRFSASWKFTWCEVETDFSRIAAAAAAAGVCYRVLLSLPCIMTCCCSSYSCSLFNDFVTLLLLSLLS